MRKWVILVVAWTLFQANAHGDDKPSLADDWKALRASSWINDKPDAAWNKLSDTFKNAYGNRGWKSVEVKFSETQARIRAGASPYRLAIDYVAVGQDKAYPAWSNLTLTLLEDKGVRYLVLKGHADVEYKVKYSFKNGKLILEGTFYSLNPMFGTPTIFDGEYSPVTVKPK